MAAINIMKLCEMYDLDVRDVFDGYIQDHVVTPLPAEELYFIAATADKQDRMRSAVVWFEELYKRVSENMYPDSSLKLITVARVLAGVYNKVCRKLAYGECLKSNYSHLVSCENLFFFFIFNRLECPRNRLNCLIRLTMKVITRSNQ